MGQFKRNCVCVIAIIASFHIVNHIMVDYVERGNKAVSVVLLSAIFRAECQEDSPGN